MMDRLRGRSPDDAEAAAGVSGRGLVARWVCGILLAALIVPLLMSAFASPAMADGDDEEEKENYSLYQLSSNASTYFGEQTSPSGDGLPGEWEPIVESAATGGSMLGYADPEFSLFNVVGWMFAEATGSKQTIAYDTLDDDAKYKGMLEYAQFGSANRDLGLDTMTAGIPGQIVGVIGGAIIWLSYLTAIIVNTVFGLAINFLQLINPFQWFYSAVAGLEDANGNTDSQYQQMLAEGMTAETGSSGFLSSVQTFIGDWYGLLQNIAWQVMVPLFLGVMIMGMLLFKKMDKGSAVKKFFVRLIFIGVGLPLVGSMYSAVLNNFDDSLMGQQAGPTRVVLSNYTDFESWMMNGRLAIPDGATIEWDGNAPSSTSQASVRTTARAINAASNPAFSGLAPGTAGGSAEDAWEDGTGNFNAGEQSDANTVFHTFGLIGRYMSGDIVAASDFESGVKTDISNLDASAEDKKDWFVNKSSYGDVEKFGVEDGPEPKDHPVISTKGQEGLAASYPENGDGDPTGVVSFQSNGADAQCRYKTGDDGGSDPANCNMSPLAAYNYLNTRFNENSLDMFSSNKLGSDLVRSDHLAVSQVGTGPAKFMNWANTGTLLSCISLLGFWYAIGMIFGAVKRTVGLIAAIPFATLGALPSIAKVITYTAALILEVIVTLFVYQFVSELLISVPEILSGPMSDLMANNDLFSATSLAGVMIVAMTIVSTFVIIGVTFAMLRVRKTVLQALDEAVTKLVDKFLETNSPPKPDKGGMLPAMAGGLGAGAGMAAGNKLAGMAGNKMGGGKLGGSPSPNSSQSKAAATNAGGMNAEKMLEGGKQVAGALGPGGDDGGPDGPTTPPTGGNGGPGGGSGPLAIGSGGGSDPDDGAAPSSSGSGSRPAKDTAQAVNANGGLSDLGYTSGEAKPGQKGATASQGKSGEQVPQGQQNRSGGSANQAGSQATAFGQTAGKDGQPGVGQAPAPTRFGAGQPGHGANGQAGQQGQPGQRSGQRPAPGGQQATKTQFGTGAQAPASGAQGGQAPTQGQRTSGAGRGPAPAQTQFGSGQQAPSTPSVSPGAGAKTAIPLPPASASRSVPSSTPAPAQGQRFAGRAQAPTQAAPVQSQRPAAQAPARPVAPAPAPQAGRTPQAPAQRTGGPAPQASAQRSGSVPAPMQGPAPKAPVQRSAPAPQAPAAPASAPPAARTPKPAPAPKAPRPAPQAQAPAPAPEGAEAPRQASSPKKPDTGRGRRRATGGGKPRKPQS